MFTLVYSSTRKYVPSQEIAEVDFSYDSIYLIHQSFRLIHILLHGIFFPIPTIPTTRWLSPALCMYLTKSMQRIPKWKHEQDADFQTCPLHHHHVGCINLKHLLSTSHTLVQGFGNILRFARRNILYCECYQCARQLYISKYVDFKHPKGKLPLNIRSGIHFKFSPIPASLIQLHASELFTRTQSAFHGDLSLRDNSSSIICLNRLGKIMIEIHQRVLHSNIII